jgi:hypothetical protein
MMVNINGMLSDLVVCQEVPQRLSFSVLLSNIYLIEAAEEPKAPFDH